ncbi:hypothetical protein [Streptomyces justiciae]|uniref:hypothetical protein n=1 Tax=Streptomyces justiciae TaxID=2780140 RepID=UPI0021187CA8|nr:hypothetical protein [Streptomyces justiciae]MCW8379802.1 hypothetical protein [Streptomyces justiciae]
MPDYSFTTLPTAVLFTVAAATSEEAEALAVQLGAETHDLDSLARLDVKIDEITFGDPADLEPAETEAGNAVTVAPDSQPLRIVRGQGGEVEVTGRIDGFAGDVLRRAGFLFEPSLRGVWIRLPFDLGRARENDRASWAAEMLTAARYHVELAPDLHAAAPGATARTGTVRPATTAAAPPGRPPRRRS